MSTGIDVFSAVATAISTLDLVIRTIRELYDARERQQNLSKTLLAHEQELDSIQQILWVVKHEKVLQVVAIMDDLEQLRLHGFSLHTALQQYGKERGQFKQYANQFFNGKRIIEDLAGIMASMTRAKANLSMNIQVVHVGLTQAVGDVVVVNCALVESLDRKLQDVFGVGKGLKLAGLLHQKQRRGDGTVHLKDADIASLSDSETSSMSGQNESLAGVTSRRVERNTTKNQAIQVNAPIGVGGFVEVDHLVIIDNEAFEKSIQVNHAVSLDIFDKILAARPAF